MIGAMPSLALDRCTSKQQGSIGHLNRKNLSLHFRPPHLSSSGQSNNVETGQVVHHCANKRLMFQISVVFPLLGLVLLFVGLVQLIPGADGEAFSFPLIMIGSVILFLGLAIILYRLFCKYETEPTQQPQQQQQGTTPGNNPTTPSLTVHTNTNANTNTMTTNTVTVTITPSTTTTASTAAATTTTTITNTQKESEIKKDVTR